jgi:hypothetical protein
MVWRRPEFRADNVGFGSECGELCGGILVHGGGRQFVGGAPLKKAGAAEEVRGRRGLLG